MALAWSPRAHISILQAFHCPHLLYTPSNGAAPGVGTSVLAAAGGTGGGSNPTNATNGQNDPLTPAAPPRISNSLGLAIEADDIGYIATIQMGTPPRDFNVLMDSGSADLWVGAEGCKTDVGGDCVSSSECFAFSVL
jgi:hypothetical protein